MVTVNHHDRQTFKKSYLKRIQCVLTFEKTEWTDELKKKANDLLKGNGFDLKATGDLSMVQGIRNATVVILTDKGMMINTDKIDYGGFDDYKIFLSEIMIPLLTMSGVKTITTCIFQKSNSYKINKGKVKMELTKEQVLSTLFTPLLTEANVPVGVMENEYFYTSQYKYEDKEETIIIELIISSMKLYEQSTEGFVERLEIVNQRMYDFWYESVSEKVRKSMEG